MPREERPTAGGPEGEEAVSASAEGGDVSAEAGDESAGAGDESAGAGTASAGAGTASAGAGTASAEAAGGDGEGWRGGFVALIGRPNVGKSTLLNALLGTKLSITTHKPQTTRNRIRGVLTLEARRAQVVFVDTPGVHDWQGKALNRRMVDAALGAIGDADLALLLIDARHALTREGEIPSDERAILERIEAVGTPAMLALNKVDLLESPERLLPIIDAYRQAHAFEALVPISALKGEQLGALLDAVVEGLEEGPLLYPPDALTDQAERFFASELIREQITLLTHREVPYSVAVEVERFEEDAGTGELRLGVVIHVERASQKGIVIGKRGSKLKQIGTRSREALERFFGRRVHLKTFVRVQEGWSEDQRSLDRFGYPSS